MMSEVLLDVRMDAKTDGISVLLSFPSDVEVGCFLITQIQMRGAEDVEITSSYITSEIADEIRKICKFKAYRYDELPSFMTEEQKFYVRDAIEAYLRTRIG